MNLIKVASAALNQTPLDWFGNKSNIIEAIQDAKANDISILCLPELCITGYGCEDAFYSPYVYQNCIEIVKEIKEITNGITVCVGLPIWYNNKIFNAACLISNRQILGFVCKQHLPNYGLFYEDRWFQRWPAANSEEITIDGIKYPIGDIQFDLSGIRLGLEICEDAWVSNRPGIRHFDKGVDIILNPSASPFAFGKFQTREMLVSDASRTFSCVYVYTNLLGNESGRLLFDGDAMIASGGEMLASSPRFSYENYTLTTAVVDIEKNRINQAKIKTPINGIKSIIYSDFDFENDLKPSFSKATLEAFEKGGFIKEEEFARAVALGLFDYLRKSKSNGFTISLSGGADSCACVALCGLMIKLGDESIGFEKFKAKLSHIKKIENCKSEKELADQIIHSIYQGTENSSDATYQSAKTLAENIGANFMSININGIVENYTSLIENELNRKLDWNSDDIALQNIQARVRAPSVWLLTNLHGHLLLATSNRSEVAVGYCTMDGDTAGSISPIAGIDKSWLRKWLIWLETMGCEVKGKHIKIEGLNKVNALQPTAELRPQSKNQTDEADLMPYEVLNEIERVAIKDKKSPLDCFIYIETQFAGIYNKEQIYQWINRFFKLWSRNQWKRERYAPSFQLDDINLDPRSWCRFPILNGSYESELIDLKDYYEGKPKTKNKKIGF